MDRGAAIVKTNNQEFLSRIRRQEIIISNFVKLEVKLDDE
jgi:hypothetical protein